MRFRSTPRRARHPISPYVYGVNQADWSGRSRPMRFGRLGGNRWTAYNWENNASNAGTDWHTRTTTTWVEATTPGEAVTAYVADTSAHNAGLGC